MIPASEWGRWRKIRSKIAKHEQELEALYAERKKAIEAMDVIMTRREIGGWWGISNPRVTQIVKGK